MASQGEPVNKKAPLRQQADGVVAKIYMVAERLEVILNKVHGVVQPGQSAAPPPSTAPVAMPHLAESISSATNKLDYVGGLLSQIEDEL